MMVYSFCEETYNSHKQMVATFEASSEVALLILS